LRRSIAAIFPLLALGTVALSIAFAARSLRQIALRVPTADLIARLETPHGSVIAGLGVAAREHANLPLLPVLAPLLGIVLIAALLPREALGISRPRRPLLVTIVAFAASIAIAAISNALPWSETRELVADQMLIVAHGVLLWGALHLGPRAWHPRSLGAALGVLVAFGVVMSLLVGGGAARRLCWAAGPQSPYERLLREQALLRARARMRSPIVRLSARMSGTTAACEDAARSLGLPP
jgi:hypothetical protein